ncbi:hypothetical protein NEOC84_000341|uniref:rhomboid family intramembrane serine protease n=1 Tax=Neochlamydia sp. AcF84 TaxID=2315858 RepID=UPI001407B665|nr:rhomboid family intramembrane serine protease [Neochlamydia sp. AcF84]NGY94465.1 hypothetical protein [Neochlamydia sp. AcF84]
MRLIGTFKNQKQAQNLSAFLKCYGIKHQLEIENNTDWGSQNYGDMIYNLWVIEEEDLEKALEKVQAFLDNPQAAMAAAPTSKSWLKEPVKEKIKEAHLKMIGQKKVQYAKPSGWGKITTTLLILCSLLLFLSTFTAPSLNRIPNKLPSTVLLNSPVHKALMYDYPYAYTIMDKIISAYGIESLQDPTEMSFQEQILLNTFNHTPYWKGLYAKLSNRFFTANASEESNPPLFEKIREGQIWRLLTPTLLHDDIFHLFFNMIWLLVLGKQMEERLRSSRYILFIVLAGILTNTLQYLMGGPNFLGFSGVLCAMLTFVWMRQKKAAWEGYQLQASTFTFIMVFIIAMFGIQLVSFLMEIYTKSAFSPGIANTAHLSGAIVGLLLGSLDFFAYKNR